MAKKIYVGNLSFNTGDESLKGVFAAHGNVVSAKVITDRDTGKSRGFGFVEMDSDSAADAAISALNGKDLDGRALRVSEARERDKGARF